MANSEVFFEGQRQIISKHVDIAKKFILVAMAWFTDKSLFEQLLRKASEGVQVLVLIHDDEVNGKSGIEYGRLNGKNSELNLIADAKRIMHHKFCVIDCYTVLHGSYNWTNQAISNHENLVVTYGDISFAAKFIIQFFKIKKSYTTKVAPENNSGLETKEPKKPVRKTRRPVNRRDDELMAKKIAEIRAKKIAALPTVVTIDFTEFPMDGKAVFRLTGEEKQGVFEFRSDDKIRLNHKELPGGKYKVEWVLSVIQSEKKYKARMVGELVTILTDWKDNIMPIDHHCPKGVYKFTRVELVQY